MKKTIVLMMFALAIYCGVCSAVEFRRAKTLDDAHSASCRVSVSNARGAGAFIGVDVDSGRALILTNYHVVTNNSRATLDFWTNGVRESIAGAVEARFYDASIPYDFAIISVDADALKRIDPPFLALGGRDAAPDANSYILSSGCPKGRFAQAWKGKVLGYYNGSTVMFQPGPVPGQSGSAIISEIDDELWVTGILTWLIGVEGSDDSKGGAIPIANLYKAIQGRQSATGDRQGLSPIPPDATECAERVPYVLEFVQDKCPPCLAAEKDVDALREAGVVVESVNVSTSADARKLAKKYGVTETPTFIVCDGNGKELARFSGAGKLASIQEAVAANTVEESEHGQEQEEPAPEPEQTTEATPLPVMEVEDDFRNRAPVYDYADAGFFDDSNARWNNRGRKNPPKVEPEEPAAPEPEKPRRLFGNEDRGLINNAINDAAKKIEKQIDDKLSTKETQIREELNALVKKWTARLAWGFLALVIIGAILAELVKQGLAALWELVKDAILFDDEQTETEEKNDDGETNQNEA